MECNGTPADKKQFQTKPHRGERAAKQKGLIRFKAALLQDYSLSYTVSASFVLFNVKKESFQLSGNMTTPLKPFTCAFAKRMEERVLRKNKI